MADTITSRQNPLVARFRAAAESDPATMLLEGGSLLDEALAAGIDIEIAAVDPSRVGDAELGRWRRRLDENRLVTVAPRVLDAMSPARTPGGVVALAPRPRWTLADAWRGPAPLVLGAVDIQDPGNLGAIARAAEAGGATALLTTGGSADPFGWKALRGAMGSAFRLPILRVASVDAAIDEARRRGARVVAAVGRGQTPMDDVALDCATLLLLGSEGQGLPAAVMAAADARVSIPMAGPVESLNVAVAAALLVYEARRQRRADHPGGAQPRTSEGGKR